MVPAGTTPPWSQWHPVPWQALAVCFK